jgi:hypothetical protein
MTAKLATKTKGLREEALEIHDAAVVGHGFNGREIPLAFQVVARRLARLSDSFSSGFPSIFAGKSLAVALEL